MKNLVMMNKISKILANSGVKREKRQKNSDFIERHESSDVLIENHSERDLRDVRIDVNQ